MKPILLNTEMLLPTIQGIKTKTRRLVKPQPNLHFRPDSQVKIYNRKGNVWEVKDTFSSDGFSILDSFKCKYEIGDILYVREKWQLVQPYGPEDYYYGYADGSYSHNKASEKYD